MVDLLCFQSFPKGEAEVGECEGTRRQKRLERGRSKNEGREREREEGKREWEPQ